MFEFIFQNSQLILEGFLLTVGITLFGIFLGLTLGILLTIGDLYGGKAVSAVIRVYVEFFRGSPLVVQLLIGRYFVPDVLHIPIDPYIVAFLVFGLNSAAYQKGYIKGAVETVFDDQMMAGLSTGMSKAQTIYHVILPQALRIVIPPWTNEFCSLTKSTAVLSYVGLMDLTGAGRTVMEYRVIETWIFIGIVYLAWITAFTKVADIIYEKKKIPGIELSV